MTDVEYLMQSVIRGLEEILMSEQGLSLPEALQLLHGSKTLELLMDEQTDLYRECPAYVYEFLRDEISEGSASISRS